jgi:cell division protein FtsQ
MNAAATVSPGTDLRLLQAAGSALFALAGLGFAVLALAWAVRQPVFQFRAIAVDGETTRNSESTIRANALPRLQGGYFTLDLTQARGAFESVPWVRKAQVRRVFPNRLAVTLEEHRAAAYWHRDEADDALVNSFGEVFEANLGDVEDEGLPTLQGPDGQAAAMLAMWRALAPVFATLDERVATLVLSPHGSWQARLESGAVVELGRGTEEEVVARTRRFAGSLTQMTDRFQRPLVHADLRHPDGYALRLRGLEVKPQETPLKKPVSR